MNGAIDKDDSDVGHAGKQNGSSPLERHQDGARLTDLLDKTGAKDAHSRLHLLAAALEEAAIPGNPLADGWRRVAIDLSSSLVREPEGSLPPRGHDDSRKPPDGEASRALADLLTRIADGSTAPSDYADAAQTLTDALVNARRTAREEAAAVEIKDEEDLKRFRRNMEDAHPVALIATLALTRRALVEITEAAKFPALQAGLKAGLDLATSKLKPAIQPEAFSIPTDRAAEPQRPGVEFNRPAAETGTGHGLPTPAELTSFVTEGLASARARLRELAIGKREGVGEAGSDSRSIGR